MAKKLFGGLVILRKRDKDKWVIFTVMYLQRLLEVLLKTPNVKSISSINIEPDFEPDPEIFPYDIIIEVFTEVTLKE